MSDWIDIEDRVPVVRQGEMMSDIVLVMSLDIDGNEYTYHSRYSRIVGFNDYLAMRWKPIDKMKD